MNDIGAIEQFYNERASEYFSQTIIADMTPLLRRFGDAVGPDALVVDAGCGSGRDSLWFLANGFRCYSYDASAALVALARKHLGAAHLVHCHRHDALGLAHPVDGIWANASLLFLNDTDLAIALRTFYRNLRPGGVLYASFKYGSGWREDGARHFRDMAPSDGALLESMSGMKLLAVHTDLDSQGRGMHWTSFLLCKASGDS